MTLEVSPSSLPILLPSHQPLTPSLLFFTHTQTSHHKHKHTPLHQHAPLPPPSLSSCTPTSSLLHHTTPSHSTPVSFPLLFLRKVRRVKTQDPEQANEWSKTMQRAPAVRKTSVTCQYLSFQFAHRFSRGLAPSQTDCTASTAEEQLVLSWMTHARGSSVEGARACNILSADAWLTFGLSTTFNLATSFGLSRRLGLARAVRARVRLPQRRTPNHQGRGSLADRFRRPYKNISYSFCAADLLLTEYRGWRVDVG